MGDNFTYNQALAFEERINKRIKYYEHRNWLKLSLTYQCDNIALKKIETLKELLRITFGVRALKGE